MGTCVPSDLNQNYPGWGSETCISKAPQESHAKDKASMEPGIKLRNH